MSPRRGLPLTLMKPMKRAAGQAHPRRISQSTIKRRTRTHTPTPTLAPRAPHLLLTSSRTRKQVEKVEKAVEGEEKKAATATAAAGWAAAAAAAATVTAATATETVAEETETVVDKVAQVEFNLRVAASKGDMAALALAEQAHCYHMPHASPSPALSALSRSALPMSHFLAPPRLSPRAPKHYLYSHCVSRPWSRRRWTLMPQTGCVLPSLSPHPTSPLRSCLNLRPLVPHPCTCCCPAATHTVVIPAARQVSTHVGGHVRLPRHVESAVLGSPAFLGLALLALGDDAPPRTQE